MSTDIVNAHISTKHMHFTRLQKGWLFREDRSVRVNTYVFYVSFMSHFNNIHIFQEPVGNYNSDFYTIHGITFKTSKRREHLSKEDVQKNKMVYDWFMRDGPTLPDEYAVGVKQLLQFILVGLRLLINSNVLFLLCLSCCSSKFLSENPCRHLQSQM